MVSRVLTSRIVRLPTTLRPSWKPGVSNKKISGKISKNDTSKKSDNSCPSKSEKPECSLPDPDVCQPPAATSEGRAKGQKEAIPCYPECRAGQPNLPPRGCLPWEKGIELCPDKEAVRKLESVTCQHICEPYVGKGFIDKFKVSACEYRRFKKCLEKKKNPRKCLGLEPRLGISRKIYPMMHAVQKQYIAGCPISSNRFVMPKKHTECEE